MFCSLIELWHVKNKNACMIIHSVKIIKRHSKEAFFIYTVINTGEKSGSTMPGGQIGNLGGEPLAGV